MLTGLALGWSGATNKLHIGGPRLPIFVRRIVSPIRLQFKNEFPYFHREAPEEPIALAISKISPVHKGQGRFLQSQRKTCRIVEFVGRGFQSFLDRWQ